VRGPRSSLLLVVVLSWSCLLWVPTWALAYVGPGPGLELLPYFWSLLAWVGLALGAVVLWPVQALVRRLRTGQPRAGRAAAGPFLDAGCLGEIHERP